MKRLTVNQRLAKRLTFAKEIIQMRDKGLIAFDQLILEFPERL